MKQALRNFNVLHQGLIRKASDLFKHRTPHKDTLVTGRHSAQTRPKVDEKGDHRKHPGSTFDLDIKPSPDSLGILDGLFENGQGMRRGDGVRMQKKQNVTLCGPRAHIHLPCATSWRVQDLETSFLYLIHGRIRAATIDNQKLGSILDESFPVIHHKMERGLFIEHGNYDGNFQRNLSPWIEFQGMLSSRETYGHAFYGEA